MRDNDHNNNKKRPSPPVAAASASAAASARSLMAATAAGYSSRTDNNTNNNDGTSLEYAAAASARRRDSTSNDNDGNQNNSDSDDDEDEDDDTTLKRLLHRLKREHESNFGKNSGANSRPNKQRAKYLLEASAGNIGLAASLYWEDYFLAEAGHGLNNNHEQDGGADNNEGGGSSARKKRSREDQSSTSSGTTTGAVSSAKKPARRKTSGLDDDDNNDNNDDHHRPRSSSRITFKELVEEHRKSVAKKGSSSSSATKAGAVAASSKQRAGRKTAGLEDNDDDSSDQSRPSRFSQNEYYNRQREYEGFAAKYRRLMDDANNNAELNAGEMLSAAAAAAAANASIPSAAAAAASAGRRSDADSNARGAASQGSMAQQAGGAAAQPNILQLGLPVGELNQFAGDIGAMGAFSGALAAALQGEQHLPPSLMQLQQQQGGGGGFDVISRVLANAGRQLESDEARAFLAALAAESGQAGANANNAPAAAAAAGGNGDDDGDDDDNDDDGDDSNNSSGDGDGGGGAPRDERDHGRLGRDDVNERRTVRRSLRLRRAEVARRLALERAEREIAERERAQREDAERERADFEHALAAIGRERGNRRENRSDGSEDETFMPGPIPVFRKEALASAKYDASRGKRKRMDDNGSNDESDNYDDDFVDIENYLYKSGDFPDPLRNLWRKFPLEDTDDENVSDREAGKFIPSSWLRSGFKLSKCANGLAMSEPNEEEWVEIRRSLPQNVRDGPLRNVKTLFPYNCKGVSAMLSLVTALIYSGVSLEKGAVSIHVDRAPFAELSLEERRRQFGQRLEDVLSSLIFIAAKAGTQRCKNMLEKYDKFTARNKVNQSYCLKMRQELEKRTHHCNVCWWDVDPTTDATIYPAGKDPEDVNVNNSFTNINDIRSYVRTHLRSFKEPGGCALLLETIIRCHGIECIESVDELLVCNCNDSLTHVGSKNNSMKSPAYDCMTPRLLSLLLTGELRDSYQNWSGDTFGIGLLRLHSDEPPNNRLLLPLKPVWLCQGDTGYSTLFLSEKKLNGHEDSFNQPGKAFHWNCWTAELSSMKISSSTYGTSLVSSTVSDDSDEEGTTGMNSICARMRREHKRNLASSSTDNAIYPSNASHIQNSPISDDEVESMKFHPDDEKYYPDQYRRWRFHFDASSSSIVPVEAWIPFYRLNERQRLVAEMKLAPRIVALIRTRWPMATVTDYSPNGQHPIV